MKFWFDGLPDVQRRTISLAKRYGDERRKTHQYYYAFKNLGPEILATGTFKTFQTVTQWLLDRKLSPGPAGETWAGYIEHVFKIMSPQIPHPGQLKNELHLKDFMKAIPTIIDTPVRTPDNMRELYAKVLAKGIHGYSPPTG